MFYDLHIHSCLSPCGDQDMTPNNIVHMAALGGLQVIALTDHNTARNCPAAMAVGKECGLLVVPGMELTTSEEVHVICLFPDLDGAMDFSEYVYKRLFPIKNVPDIFGGQIVMDKEDRPVAQVDSLLINATEISVMEVAGLMKTYGGICYPAHIDKNSNSILSNIGGIPPECGFTLVEFSKAADKAAVLRSHPDIGAMGHVQSSDAHYLQDIGGAAREIEVCTPTAYGVIQALQKLGRQGAAGRQEE